jgi:hypothetical protein
MVIEKFRPVEDDRSIGKPDHDAVVSLIHSPLASTRVSIMDVTSELLRQYIDLVSVGIAVSRLPMPELIEQCFRLA